MPSPFPGMDPYIEGQEWDDFHTRLMTGIADALSPKLLPRYVARLERRVYLEHNTSTFARHFRPDVAVIDAGSYPRRSEEGGVAVAPSPIIVTLPLPERREEVFPELRAPDTGELVTVIECLSPTNKRPGSDGLREYRAKRETILGSAVHLIEIDLLRGGERVPVLEPLPPVRYLGILSRALRRPYAQLWPIRLQDRLPAVPVPLAGVDPDTAFDLQAVFEAIYDRAGYRYSLNYDRMPEPPLEQAEQDWAGRLLSGPPE